MRSLRPLQSALLTLGLLLSLSPPAVAQPAEEMPLVLDSKFAELGPLWVSARSVTESAPDKWTFLRQAERRHIGYATERADYEAGDCIVFGETMVTLVPGLSYPASLRDLVHSSIAILEGTVTGTDHGFYNSEPGTLLRVKVAEALLPSELIWPSGWIYFFYPVGRFDAAGYRICKEDYRVPSVPELGEQLLILAQAAPADEARSILYDNLQAFFVVDEAGELQSPGPWQDDLRALRVGTLAKLREWIAVERSRKPGLER